MTNTVNDLTGQRFGRLVVLYRVVRTGLKESHWKCVCDCGSETVVRGHDLKAGHQKSCGCARGSNRITDEQFSYQALQRRSRNRGLDFTLTFEQFCVIVRQACHYCGEPPKTRVIVRSGHGNRNPTRTMTLNGIDRVNSSLGYIPENVVPCCTHCNQAKNDMSTEEFRLWLIRVYKHAAEGGW